jgi:hypothetical protein
MALAIADVELRHDGLLALLHGSSGAQILYNSGTGESCELESLDNDWCLSFDDGYAKVTSGDVVRQATAVFNKSLHACPRFGFRCDQRYVFDKVLKTSSWARNLETKHTKKVFEFKFNNTTYSCESYIYNLKTDSDFTVYWACPHLVFNFLGQKVRENYIAEGAVSWQKWLDRVAFPGKHIQQSLTSAKLTATRRAESIDAHLSLVLAQEFCITTPGVLILLSFWAHTRAAKTDDMSMRSAAFVRRLTESLPGSDVAVMFLLPDFHESVRATMIGGVIRISDVRPYLNKKGAVLAVFKDDDELSVYEFLKRGAYLLVRPSRARPELVECVRKSIIVVVDWVSRHVEAHRATMQWAASHLALKPLPGAIKTRRLSTQYKYDCAKAVTTNPELHSTRAFVAAQKAMAIVNGESTRAIATSTSSSFDACNQYQYWATMRLEHRGIRQLSISIDGVRAGNEDTLVALSRAPEKKLCSVPSPQVQLERVRGPISTCWRSKT